MIERLKSYVVERLGINRLAEEIARVGIRVDVLNGEFRAAQERIASMEAQLVDLRNRQDDLRRRDRIVSMTTWSAGAPLRHRPLISVVMATRNRAELLVDALDSVVGQSYDRWELVVVDDGSEDATSDVVSERAATDQRIRLQVTEGVGAAAARNVGIQAATGDYVAFSTTTTRLLPAGSGASPSSRGADRRSGRSTASRSGKTSPTRTCSRGCTSSRRSTSLRCAPRITSISARSSFAATIANSASTNR